jgi:hypothetical protein
MQLIMIGAALGFVFGWIVGGQSLAVWMCAGYVVLAVVIELIRRSGR